MSGPPDLDIAPLRARIAVALADDAATGQLVEHLRSLELDAAPPSAASVRRVIEMVPDLIAEAQAAYGPESLHIHEALRAMMAGWQLEQDVSSGASGLPGLIDDALLTLELLDILDRWYLDKTERQLILTSISGPAKTLRAALPQELRQQVATQAAVIAQIDLPRYSPPAVESTEAIGPVVRGIKHADAIATPQPAARLYDVWYATNRRPVGDGFGDATDDTVHYGVCSVAVPKTHLFGSVGTPWWKRWLKLQFTDDRLKIVRTVEARDAAAFFGDLSAELSALAEHERQILFYLHGYNVSFEGAALRAAQIGFDLRVPGVTAFFSWPSIASLDAYFADADRIAASEAQITEFLVRLAAQTDGGVVHIIAHSMGNRGLARAIQRITLSASQTANLRFGQIILAAPDIEASLFRDLARIYPQISRRTTMYVSARDRALGMSKWLQNSNRAGFTPPVTVVPQIDTIEVTNIDLTMLGHGYYAEAEPVLYDIKELLEHGSAPDRRLRLSRAGNADSEYWIIGK